LDKEKLNQQSQHWEDNFSSKPEMFGLEPSLAARKALELFKQKNLKNVLELGFGLGRDSIFFAYNSIKLKVLDYSPSAIKIINQKIEKNNLTKFISAKLFDVRKKLPFEDNSFEACYSHMLYCMAMTKEELENLNDEICRILKPDGINIYTVRHIYDGDFKRGIHHGENLYENDGFIVHFFSKETVKYLLKGFENLLIDEFEEGNYPRKLYFVANKKL
jgi:SAM-dependent methyltransferase